MSHYQYFRNRQGSTMAVVDDSGAVVQRTGYYATGTPFVLPVDAADSNGTPALDGVTDRLHIGNRWLGLSGLAMYDNSARVHDPVMPHFLTCDSRAGDYTWLSPFSHCAGNPANIVDWDGNEWTDLEGTTIEELRKIKVYIFHTNDFSSQAKIQYNDAIKKYGNESVAISNTGSSKGFAEDWSKMDGSVEKVMIMAHGKNQSINLSNNDSDVYQQLTSTGDGKTNKTQTPAINIQELPSPENADLSNAELLLYTCHSADNSNPPQKGQGALSGSMQTVADAFSQTTDFKFVQGTKGSVNYYNWYRSIHNPSIYLQPYPVDGTWLRFVK